MRPITHGHGRMLTRAVLAAAIVGSLAFTLVWPDHPKRFAPVVDGRLYRCGSVTPPQLAWARDEYGIRRVLCLLNPAAVETQEERAAAERLGLAWSNVPLPGNGASTPEDRRQILAWLREADDGPGLVHCAAGVNRTGLAVGLYRLHVEGWPLERVLAELRANGFEDEPKHENLRQALAAEAELAKQAAAPREE